MARATNHDGLHHSDGKHFLQRAAEAARKHKKKLIAIGAAGAIAATAHFFPQGHYQKMRRTLEEQNVRRPQLWTEYIREIEMHPMGYSGWEQKLSNLPPTAKNKIMDITEGIKGKNPDRLDLMRVLTAIHEYASPNSAVTEANIERLGKSRVNATREKATREFWNYYKTVKDPAERRAIDQFLYEGKR